jgi:hypothetical protein
MITVFRTPGLFLVSCALLVLAGCGSPDESDYDDDEYASVESADFDESTLPEDFPRELIPASYHNGAYVKLGQVESASFENGENVEETIRHYTGLLGEPASLLDGDGTDAIAQWRTTPWAVSVIGNDGESIIGFTKAAN